MDERIAFLREAVEFLPPEHPDRPLRLDDLGTAYLARFRSQKHPEDLDASIYNYRQAFELQPPPQVHTNLLFRLGSMHRLRFDMEGRVPDRDDGIRFLQDFVDSVPPIFPQRPLALLHLGMLIFHCFGAEGAISDLNQAIQLFSEASRLFESAPDHAPDPSGTGSLCNSCLGGATLSRFHLEGQSNLEDLDNGIYYLRMSLQPTSLTPTERYTRLQTLIRALCARFRLQGELTDRKQAIDYYREVQALCTPDEPAGSAVLSQLAAQISYSFDQREGGDPSAGPQGEMDSDVATRVKRSLLDKKFHLFWVTGDSVGIGGFCEVLLGLYSPNRMRLALKRPRMFSSQPEDVLRRFHREARMWSELNHPNILPFLGVLEQRNHIYLVSPWLERGSLSAVMRDHIALSEFSDEHNTAEGLALRSWFQEGKVIREVAAGLAYLHSKGFVHGDLKGPNVLFAEDGRAVLCDFGLTKALDMTDCEDTSSAMKGAGSQRWQSPELFFNEPKTSKSDVYAFSMVIVEVLTGMPPLPHLSDMAFVNKLLNDEERPQWVPLSRGGRDFTPFWRIASRCWATEASDRPTMAQVLEELDGDMDNYGRKAGAKVGKLGLISLVVIGLMISRRWARGV